jgi:hypothetical protein
MEDNVKSYEVANLVFNPGDDLDEILSVNDNISLSQAFYDLSKQYQAAAEYFLLLSEKLNDVADSSVDVDCNEDFIVLEGNHPVLDELVANGFLTEVGTDTSSPYEEEYMNEDHNWMGVDEEEYPYDFERSEAE